MPKSDPSQKSIAERHIEEHLDVLEESILHACLKPQRIEDLIESLKVQDEAALNLIVERLKLRGKIIEVSGKRLITPKGDTAVGYIGHSRKGQSVFLPDSHDLPKMEIPGRTDAIEGDRVLVSYSVQAHQAHRRHRFSPPGKERKRHIAQVISILKKRPTEVSGVYAVNEYGEDTVKLQGRDRPRQVAINPPPEAKLRHGMVIKVELPRTRSMRGTLATFLSVVSDLHNANDDVASVAALYEFPLAFPDEVEREMQALPDDPEPADLQGRLDLLERITVVIDPHDAKDHDDGFSIEEGPDGTWRLAVHIADVSHYVRPGTATNAEAFTRGTSVYMPGMTVPMLPQKLSAGLCSLKQGKVRLAKTAFLTYDKQGRLLRREVVQSIIRVDAFIDYERAMAVLDGSGTSGSPEVDAAIKLGGRLAMILRERRIEKGSVMLSIDRPHLVVDKEGLILKIETDRQDQSHQLIEEFMLAANCAVAEFMHERNLPFMGRVHPAPEEDGEAAFAEFCDELGVSAPRFDDSRRVQLFLEGIGDREGAHAIHLAVLKTMQRAIYAPGPGLHYALAFHYYTHYTSPIRRLCDLRVHQVLAAYLQAGGVFKWQADSGASSTPWADGQPMPERELPSKGVPGMRDLRMGMAESASQATQTEQRAQRAEMEATFLKLLRTMYERIGEVFQGTITHISSFGITVQLDEVWIEGTLPFSQLTDAWVTTHKFWAEYEAREGVKRLRVGDRAKVTVMEADTASRSLILALGEAKPGRPRPAGEFVDHRRGAKGSKGSKAFPSSGRQPGQQRGKAGGAKKAGKRSKRPGTRPKRGKGR